MKLATIVGARPQFVKAAAVSRAIARHNRENTPERRIDESLLHSGQHYDAELSSDLERELGLAPPIRHLASSGRTGAAQLGSITMGLADALAEEVPDVVLVYGDTNSTAAGALAAAHLGIPLVHVEAGMRSGCRNMPEELNRIVTDHLSTLLCCSSERAASQLATEGIADGVHVVGDVMLDTLRYALNTLPDGPPIVGEAPLEPGNYVLATVHRAANTDDPTRLHTILDALGDVAAQGVRVVFPVHPRTRQRIGDTLVPAGVDVIDPVGHGDTLRLARGARSVATDSGGLQKEAYWLGTPCVTFRAESEWPETVEAGWNVLVDVDMQQIVGACIAPSPPEHRPPLYGDGDAADRIVDLVSRSLGRPTSSPEPS